MLGHGQTSNSYRFLIYEAILMCYHELIFLLIKHLPAPLNCDCDTVLVDCSKLPQDLLKLKYSSLTQLSFNKIPPWYK